MDGNHLQGVERRRLAAPELDECEQGPILMISSYEYVEYVDGQMVTACLSPVDSLWPASFFVGSIVLFFIVPLFILVVLYSVIAKNLMDNPSIIMSNASSGNRGNVYKYRKQVIFMLGAVVVSFFVCLLPFRAFTLWIIIVPSEAIVSIGIERFYILLYFCRIMLYMNSAINPILYNLMSSKFRNGFLQLLGCGKIVRSDSISSGARKGGGTFHTGSTNLSSSHGTHGSMQRKSVREDGGGSLNGTNSIRRPTVQFQQPPVIIPSQQHRPSQGSSQRRHASIISIRSTIQTMADPPAEEEHTKIEEETEEGCGAHSTIPDTYQQQPSTALPNSNGFYRIKDKVRFNGHQSHRTKWHLRRNHSSSFDRSQANATGKQPSTHLDPHEDSPNEQLHSGNSRHQDNDNKRFSLLQATTIAATTTVVMIVASDETEQPDTAAGHEGFEHDNRSGDECITETTMPTVVGDGCSLEKVTICERRLIDGSRECDI